jgi:hypothetical protein
MTSKYQNVATKVRKAFNSGNKNMLESALKQMLEDYEHYHKLVEIKGKSSCPLAERYLEVIDVESSASKLTLNPVDGRCTLKVSNKASPKVKEQLIKLANKLLLEDIPPLTVRGQVKYYNGGYECQLLSESRKVKHFIRIEEEI